MTTQEFSDAFDSYLGSFNYPAGFGQQASYATLTLDEYEKSLFLTQAQEELVTAAYAGRTFNGDSFEKTEEYRRLLDCLIKTCVVKRIEDDKGYPKLTKDSVLYSLPPDVMYITYEQLHVQSTDPECANESIVIDVVPMRQDEFARAARDPFKKYNNRRAFRLDVGPTLTNRRVELVTTYSNKDDYNLTYTMRYIKFPNPIVLTDLPDGLSINGMPFEQGSELSEEFHKNILERAVQLARNYLATKSQS